MEAFLVSTGIVALAEIGDKTQLLALVLAARYRKPVPIVLGIFIATLLNHALAGSVGAVLARLVDPGVLRWILALAFIAMAVWMLLPDRLDEEITRPPRFGVLLTTLVAFFLLEMGDKTQVATVALAARYSQLAAVIMGTTVGMLVANVPAVLLGDVVATKLPLRLVHGVCAAVFAVMGILLLVAPLA